jgi:hypothetical protein
MPEHAGHYALVVGIDHYLRFRSLQGARKDAEDFHAWLMDPDGVRGGRQHRRIPTPGR